MRKKWFYVTVLWEPTLEQIILPTLDYNKRKAKKYHTSAGTHVIKVEEASKHKHKD